MMGQGFGDSIEGAMVALIIIIAAVCTAGGALLMWGLPKVWEWVKPFLHNLTS